MTTESFYNDVTNAKGCNATITWGYSISDVRIVGYVFAFSPVLVLLLNATASYYIIKAKKFKIHTRIFLLSLTVSDALVACLVMPFRIYDMIADGRMDNTICNLGNSFDVLLSFASMFSMTVLSFDRYIATCRPFEVGYWFKTSKSAILLILTWLIPAFLGFVFIPLKLTIKGVTARYICLTEKTKSCLFMTNSPYATTLTLLFLFLAMIVVICNKNTFSSVKRRTEIFYKVIFSTKPIPVYRRHYGFKTARMIIWMTFCFIVCWLPFFMVNTLDPLLGYRVPQYIWTVTMWLAYANCALNPVLYLWSAGVLKFSK